MQSTMTRAASGLPSLRAAADIRSRRSTSDPSARSVEARVGPLNLRWSMTSAAPACANTSAFFRW